jgi:hypothetical protein
VAELNATPRKPWVGLAIGIVIGLLLFGSCFVLGSAYFLAARPPPRSTQSEVKTNLKYAFACEKSFFVEHDRYDESIEVVGFMPERGTRYRYVFSRTGVIVGVALLLALLLSCLGFGGLFFFTTV